jgi:hypothetical protein
MNIDLNTIGNIFAVTNVENFFIKAFAIVLSFVYLLYSIVITRQIGVMNRTLRTPLGTFLTFISFIQILAAIGLVLCAIFLI